VDSFTLEEMQRIQAELQEKYKDKWEGIGPALAKNKLLWMYGEMGEVGDILKKKGHDAVMNDPEVRAHFVEEMCDVLMYFNDVMLCMGITPDELKRVYLAKHKRNMSRW